MSLWERIKGYSFGNPISRDAHLHVFRPDEHILVKAPKPRIKRIGERYRCSGTMGWQRGYYGMTGYCVGWGRTSMDAYIDWERNWYRNEAIRNAGK